MRKWTYSLILGITILIQTCSQDYSVYRAFYHWKSIPDEENFIKEVVDTLALQKIYWRAFDIKWSERHQMPIPVGTAKQIEQGTGSGKIIPTIFITNQTFYHLKEEQIDDLIDNILNKINSTSSKANAIQIDCDWSRSTRALYFLFLEKFKAKTDWDISVTLRLHQIKYADQTGVPPVDRAMLMFYNMGDLEDWEEPNSILNLDKAKPYLPALKGYPLDLDLALPLFHWGVLFRQGKMIKLLNNCSEATLSDTTRFEPLTDFKYKVKKSTYLDGLYTYKEDLIRLEMINFEKLEEAIDLVQPYYKGKSFTLALYHLDDYLINRFKYEEIEQIFKRFD